MKKVVITIAGVFPFGRAYALRALSFARLFQKISYDVVVLCDYTDDFHLVDENGLGDFEGIKFYARNRKPSRVQKAYIGFDYKRRLKYVLEKEKPNLIFSSSMYDRFYSVYSEAKESGIPLIIESCEWYDYSTFKRGRFSHHYILFQLSWNKFFIKADGVVAISRVLETRYRSYLTNVIRIPTIIDVEKVKFDDSNKRNGKIKLLFAGTLARTKDSIREFIEAIDLDLRFEDSFEFHICGVSEDELRNHLSDSLFIKRKNNIICYDKVPQSHISELYLKCDYGIFLRPNQRSSHAGFSTKLGEGMSTGTPFIINDTSDVSLFVENNVNGFILPSRSIESVAEVYNCILSMTGKERSEMRKNARTTAKKFFDYNAYTSDFKKFIDFYELN